MSATNEPEKCGFCGSEVLRWYQNPRANFKELYELRCQGCNRILDRKGKDERPEGVIIGESKPAAEEDDPDPDSSNPKRHIVPRTPAVCYEFRHERPRGQLGGTRFDAVFIFQVTIAEGEGGWGFEVGWTYQYEVAIIETRDGVSDEHVLQNVLRRATPRDGNFTVAENLVGVTAIKRQSRVLREVITLKRYSVHREASVRWQPPAVRERAHPASAQKRAEDA